MPSSESEDRSSEAPETASEGTEGREERAPGRIGVFGGTFNPIHEGHLHVARAARDRLGLARLLLVPVFYPPHKDPRELLARGTMRLAMIREAIVGEERLEACDLEVRRGGISYTIDTLRELHEREGPGASFVFLIGADTVRELHTWKDIAAIFDLTDFAVVPRPGADPRETSALRGTVPEEAIARLERSVLDVEPLDVSSTEIRRRCANMEPIGDHVPEAVKTFIRLKGLYRRLRG